MGLGLERKFLGVRVLGPRAVRESDACLSARFLRMREPTVQCSNPPRIGPNTTHIVASDVDIEEGTQVR